MAEVRVLYTHKRGSHFDPHERIAGIAGHDWYRTEKQVIDDIDHGVNSYYVNVNGDRVKVVTASRNERRYLKTETDGYQPDNLLALPEPPSKLLPQ